MRTLSPERLTAALDEIGGTPKLDYLDSIVAQARRTRQRPAWTFLERWLPMAIALRPAAVLPRVAVFMALLAGLLALLVISYLLAGAAPTVPTVLPVGNGLIALASNGDIDVVQPDGSGRHPLISGPAFQTFPSWSPDGTKLAFWSQDAAGAPWSVIVVNADGSAPITIATSNVIGTNLAGMSRLRWSPDGRTIAYSAPTARPGQISCVGFGYQNGDFCSYRIFVAATDGSGSGQIGDPNLDARSPAWSPDGSTIAFGGGNAAQEVDLYAMGSDGSHVRRLGTAKGTDWAFVYVDWSPDGSTVVGQAGSAADVNDWDIWVTKADGSAETDISNDASTDEELPDYAPDRPAIAWFRDQIAVQEPDGEATDLPGPAGEPSWSPDGRLIATISGDSITSFDVMDLTGAVRVSIPGPYDGCCSYTGFSWQPSVMNP
jgi:Tol biopolymer transport system component